LPDQAVEDVFAFQTQLKLKGNQWIHIFMIPSHNYMRPTNRGERMSEQQCRQLDEQGYLIFKNVLSPREPALFGLEEE
jgi:hypothetical protein